MSRQIQFLFKQVLIIFLLILKTNISNGQNFTINQTPRNLPKVFTNLNDSISLNINGLTSFFNKRNGETVLLDLGNETILEGLIESVSTKYNDKLTSVSIKFSSPHPLLFTISKIVVAPDNIVYRGHLSGKDIGDCFELIQKQEQLIFIKKNVDALRME